MNHYILGSLILAVCSSCSVYQYNVLESDIPGNADEPFTMENDTLRLRYSFPKGQATIEILNKSKNPLYIDWSRSAMIVDGKSSQYWTDQSTVELTTREYKAQLSRNLSYTTGVISHTSPITFIPPNAEVTHAPFNILYQSQPAVRYKRDEQEYTSESSPLKFRSYLFLSFDQDFTHPITPDHTFWLSERRQTTEPIPFKPRQNSYSGSVLTKGGGAVIGVLAVIAAIPLVALYVAAQ